MREHIEKLLRFLKKGDESKAEVIEEELAESIEKAIKEDLFFSLPTKEIIKIIQKRDISNVETYSNIIVRMCESKGGKAAFVLNAVKPKEATFEECVKIVSSLKCSPVCVRLGELHEEYEGLVERDYEDEISKLKQEIEELKLKQSKRTVFEPVTEKPSDFESSIHLAATKGKLSSIQFLIEQLVREKVEVKDGLYGYAPIHLASDKGHIDVVKYLIEQCHANAEAKIKNGGTPLHIASEEGHIEVVKYLIEECNVNVEAKNNYGNTPLHVASSKGQIEVIKYLIEQSHANVEAKNNDGRTPLHIVSIKGNTEIVKYLIEQCHANVEAKDNKGNTPSDCASMYSQWTFASL
jgi:hypothetical protein